ncbi:MAG: PAS domain S-box protein [Alphaproteobacteria bacterium]|nr:PAS domain S-box protein [Alphaproteobacteria bacterium]
MRPHASARQALPWLRARPRLVRYGLAAAGCAAMAGAALLARAIGLDPPVFLLFEPIVCAAAMLGGLGPGLLATALGLSGAGVIAGWEGSSPFVFAAVGLAASFGGDWLLRKRRDGDRAAEALAEREAHLRTIYDTAPDALIVIDAAGIIQSYSAAAERMFGWSPSETLGRNVAMLMPQQDRAHHDGYVSRYIETGERRIIGIGRIVVGERKDGTTFPLELAVGEVRSDRGRVFTGFLRDLTEHQATEMRLQELQTELTHMSRLTAMGEMASALAHEINQPLSAITNYLAGARRLMERADGGDPRAADALEKAAAQALRAGEIIRRIRDFLSRSEEQRRVESLPRLVQEACALAMVGARESGVRVRYAFAPDVNDVVVDRIQIQQVVINLVRNALDAMAHQPNREIDVSTCAEGDALARISVADTGPGVAKEAAARLFQPFVTTKPDGMGVGLSISRSIIEAHGGRIWMEPNPRGGAIFHFTVRRAPPSSSEQRDG